MPASSPPFFQNLFFFVFLLSWSAAVLLFPSFPPLDPPCGPAQGRMRQHPSDWKRHWLLRTDGAHLCQEEEAYIQSGPLFQRKHPGSGLSPSSSGKSLGNRRPIQRRPNSTGRREGMGGREAQDGLKHTRKKKRKCLNIRVKSFLPNSCSSSSVNWPRIGS